MKYHIRLWRNSVAIQFLILALTAGICLCLTFGVVLNDITRISLTQLETIEDNVQGRMASLEKQLEGMAGFSGNELGSWLETLQSGIAGREAVMAKQQLQDWLIETIATMEYIDGISIVGGGRTLQAGNMGREKGDWYISGENGCVVLDVYGKRQQDMIAVKVGERSYLAVSLDIDKIFSSTLDTVFVYDEEGKRIYGTGESRELAGITDNYAAELMETGSMRVGRNGIQGFFRAGETPYCLISWQNEDGSRLYLQMFSLQEMLGVMKAPFGKYMAAFLLLMGLMAFLLYYVSRLAVRPLVQIAKRLEESPLGEDSFGQNMGKGNLSRRVYGVFSITLVPVLLLTALTYRLFSPVTEFCMRTTCEQYVGEMAETIGRNHSLLEFYMKKVYSSPELRSWLSSYVVASEEQDGQREMEALKLLVSLLSGMDRVRGIRLYDRQGDELLCTMDFEPRLNPGLVEGYEDSYRAAEYFYDADEDTLILLFPIRAIDPTPAYQRFSCLGFVELYADAPMARELHDGLLPGQENWYVYDSSRWQLAWGRNSAMKALAEGMGQGGILCSVPGAQWYTARLDKIWFFTSKKIPGTEWYLMTAFSGEMFSAPYTILAYVMLLATLFFFFFFFLPVSYFSGRFMESSRALTDYMKACASRDGDVPAWAGEKNEIAVIAFTFERVFGEMKRLEQEKLKAREERIVLEKRRRKAEIVVVQSQLDAHLIGNLFASMLLQLRMKELDSLRHTLQAAGQFFHNELSMVDTDVSLAQEIALTKSYMELQRIHYGDRILAVWLPFELALEQATVPKFILQPVIENAIAHGYTGDPLQIHISITEGAGELRFLVRNDGQEIERERLDALNSRIHSDMPADHIGLWNIMERLRLRYDADCDVRVDIDEDGWFTVEVRLPYRGAEDV